MIPIFQEKPSWGDSVKLMSDYFVSATIFIIHVYVYPLHVIPHSQLIRTHRPRRPSSRSRCTSRCSSLIPISTAQSRTCRTIGLRSEHYEVLMLLVGGRKSPLTHLVVGFLKPAATTLCPVPGHLPDLFKRHSGVICRKYAEVQHLSSMSEANYKKVMIESESIRVLCVCVALLSIL